jgi:hypothetical protein
MPVGMCFMAVTDPKTVKNSVHLDLTSSVQDRDQAIEQLLTPPPQGRHRAGWRRVPDQGSTPSGTGRHCWRHERAWLR